MTNNRRVDRVLVNTRGKDLTVASEETRLYRAERPEDRQRDQD